MKTTIHITLLIIISIMLFGCQKWKQVSVEGHIYEYGTDKPVENATVSLYEFVANDLGGSYYFLDSIHTDANGYYEYHQIDEENLYVSLEVKKKKYFTIDYYNPIEYYFLPNNGDVTMDVELDPEAYLTIEIVDNPEIDGYGVKLFCVCLANGAGDYFNYQTKISSPVPGNKFISLRYNIIDDQDSESIKDSIYIDAFEEKTYTIEF